MKTLFITNGQATYAKAVTAWLKRSHKDATMDAKEKFITISCRDEYESHGRLRALFAGNEDQSYVVIVPELGWEKNGGYDAGYEVALDLLNERVSGKFFVLVFISNLDRGQLRRVVSEKYRVLVDAFPHLCLYDLPGQKESVTYSRLHFEMIRRIAVSKSGRLDALIHKLGGIRNKSLEKARGELDEVITVLSLPMYRACIKRGAGTLQSLRDELPVLTEEGLSAFVDRLTLLANEVKRGLNPWGELLPEGGAKKDLYPESVLVVEDDADFRSRLSGLLGLYFKKGNMKILNDGELLLSPGKIAELAKGYDIVLLDLLFNDVSGKAWLSFNGFDIYQEILAVDPRKVIRIMTSLPREEVMRIVRTDADLAKHPPVVLTKGKGWDPFAESLVTALPEIVKESRDVARQENRSMHFPVNGPFAKPDLQEWLKEHSKDGDEEMEEVIAYSRKVLSGENKLPNGNVPGITPSRGAKEVLKVVLAHRRIALAYSSADEGGEIEQSSYEDFFNRFTSSPVSKSFTTNYFTTKLGLSLTNECSINHTDLFGFEETFVEEEGEPLTGPIGLWAREVIADVVNPESRDGSKMYDAMRVPLDEIVLDGDVRRALFTQPLPSGVPKKRFEKLLESILFYLGTNADINDKIALQDRVAENENATVFKEMRELGYTVIPELFEEIINMPL